MWPLDDGLKHVIYEKRLRAGTTQPAEEEAQGDPISVYKHLMGKVKKTQPDCSQWCLVKEQEAMGPD